MIIRRRSQVEPPHHAILDIPIKADIGEACPQAVTLRFNPYGGGYARAKEVADFSGLDIREYLYQCIAEGHKTLRQRMEQDLEIPTFLRTP